MIDIYVDGGVIGKNPSPIGGTWAARLVYLGSSIIQSDSGYIEIKGITNNQAEFIAMLQGIYKAAGRDFHLEDVWNVYSDSRVTLGRFSKGWALNGIEPYWVRFFHHLKKSSDYYNIQFKFVAGHPTKEELKAGVNRKGFPVSEHQVWCDKECRRLAKERLNGK